MRRLCMLSLLVPVAVPEDGQRMTFREYCGILRANLECFRAIYSHPDSLALGDDPDRRVERLRAGLDRLGV